jgi:hypothetical protein
VSESVPYAGPIIDLSQRYATTRESLMRLSYVSRRSTELSDDVMFNVLLSSAVRNYLAGISSTVWSSHAYIVQTLEGTASVIEPFYHRICSDDRHHEVTCFDRVRIEARSFARPLVLKRVHDEKWSAMGVPFDLPETSFDDACRLLIRRGAVTATR